MVHFLVPASPLEVHLAVSCDQPFLSRSSRDDEGHILKALA